jgi:hypothetical protein
MVQLVSTTTSFCLQLADAEDAEAARIVAVIAWDNLKKAGRGRPPSASMADLEPGTISCNADRTWHLYTRLDRKTRRLLEKMPPGTARLLHNAGVGDEDNLKAFQGLKHQDRGAYIRRLETGDTGIRASDFLKNFSPDMRIKANRIAAGLPVAANPTSEKRPDMRIKANRIAAGLLVDHAPERRPDMRLKSNRIAAGLPVGEAKRSERAAGVYVHPSQLRKIERVLGEVCQELRFVCGVLGDRMPPRLKDAAERLSGYDQDT